MVYEPVNACILLLGQIDGKELVTVDDLAGGRKTASGAEGLCRQSRARNAASARRASSCRLFTLYHAGRKPTRQEIVDMIAGNLCRCTGYRPIVDAAVKSCTGKPADAWAGSGRGNGSSIGSA